MIWGYKYLACLALDSRLEFDQENQRGEDSRRVSPILVDSEPHAAHSDSPVQLALGDVCVFHEDVTALAEGYLTARSGTVATVLHVGDGWAYGRTEEEDGWFSEAGPFRVLPGGAAPPCPDGDGLASRARGHSGLSSKLHKVA